MPAPDFPFRIASPSGGLPSAVGWAQLLMQDRLRAGDVAVDATVGNGHDTLFLAQLVGGEGHVFGMDVQAAAVAETQRRLREEGIEEARVTLHCAGHERLAEWLPAEQHGRVRGIMFNLGYLPGSDKTVITRTSTTLQALQAAVDLLAPGGLLTVAIYPGHEGGAEEQKAVAEWAAGLPPARFEAQLMRPLNRLAAPPECCAVFKKA
jgi:SAM-dependent methyltransferase